MNTQFELEQQILDCWHITGDLDTIATAIMDHNYDVDKVVNLLLGLKELYEIRFEKCFSTFEDLLSEFYNKKENKK